MSFKLNPTVKAQQWTDQQSCSVISPVSSHVGGPHRGRLVLPDERQHYYQRLHWSHTQGLERRDRRMYPHPLWAYLNSALHAPTWEKVWADPVVYFCTVELFFHGYDADLANKNNGLMSWMTVLICKFNKKKKKAQMLKICCSFWFCDIKLNIIGCNVSH